ncbi:MAG: putative rane protein phage related [Herminiimonas sp.]|nr:putative rane protein phage related [Herminiimonas sp.]
MANDFKIVISATDKATASIKRINDSISKMTRPFENVQRSMKSLSKELDRNPVVKGMKKISNAALGVAESVAKIAAPMAALIGIGSVTGISMLVSEWGKLGFEVSKTSALLDVSASSLQTLRGAAQLAGVSSEELTGGLTNLQTTLQDAKWGRNSAVAGLMSRLGMSFHQTANGSVDVIKSFDDIADAIAAQKDIGAKHTLARGFGVESNLPYLMKSRAERKKLQQEAQRLNPLLDPEKGAAYTEQILRMNMALQGLKNTIGSSLMPVLQPLVEKFTSFVALNREDIGKNIADWTDRFTKWIKSDDFKKLKDDLEKIGNSIGWVIGKVGDLITAFGKISPAINLLPPPVKAAMSAWGAILGGGATGGKREASGTITGLSPAAQGGSGSPLGIRNNNPGNLRSWGGAPTQNGFAVFPTAEAGILAMAKQLQLYGSRGNDTISGIISKWAPSSDNNNTGAYIDQVSRQTGLPASQRLNMKDPSVLSPLMAAMIQHENGQQPYSKSTIDDAASRSIELTLHGLPQGVTATARTKAGSITPVRVATGMPQMAMP